MTGLQSSIFRVLDGHVFEFNGASCHVEVYGVFDDGPRRWVQLALGGTRHQMLTLRLDADGDAIPATVVSQMNERE